MSSLLHMIHAIITTHDSFYGFSSLLFSALYFLVTFTNFVNYPYLSVGSGENTDQLLSASRSSNGISRCSTTYMPEIL